MNNDREIQEKIKADQILRFCTTGVTRCGSTLFPGPLPWLLGMVVRTKKRGRGCGLTESKTFQFQRFNTVFFPQFQGKKAFPWVRDPAADQN